MERHHPTKFGDCRHCDSADDFNLSRNFATSIDQEVT